MHKEWHYYIESQATHLYGIRSKLVPSTEEPCAVWHTDIQVLSRTTSFIPLLMPEMSPLT